MEFIFIGIIVLAIIILISGIKFVPQANEIGRASCRERV